MSTRGDTQQTEGTGPIGLADAIRFPVLDSVRAIGAIMVLATHTTFTAGAYLRHGWIGTFFSRLDAGVAIFFVLSGFLLSRQWLLKGMTQQPLPHPLDYAWKRFLRVYPPYLVGILFALLLVHQRQSISPVRWITNLTLTDIYFFEELPDGMTQMWSLQTEVAFYALLPVLAYVVLSRRRSSTVVSIRGVSRRILALAFTLLAINLAWYPLLDHLQVESVTPALWLPAYFNWFAAGMLLAWAHLVHQLDTSGHPPGPVRALIRLGATPWSCYAAALSLLLVASTPLAGPVALVPPTVGQQVTKNLLYCFVGVLVVLPGVFGDVRTTFHRLMSHPLSRRLGEISYGIFCIHLPILSFVLWATPYELFLGHGWEIFALTLILSLIAAEAIRQLVEVPAAGLRHVVGDWLRDRRQTD